jgi:hypothetical protein
MSEPRQQGVGSSGASSVSGDAPRGSEQQRIEELVQAAWAGTLSGHERPEETLKATPELMATVAAARVAAVAPQRAMTDVALEATIAPGADRPSPADAHTDATLAAPVARPVRPAQPVSPENATGAALPATVASPQLTLRAGRIVFPPGFDGRCPVASAAGEEAEFEVLRLIGRGGMGVVYAALQGSLRREVALKMVLQEHARTPGAAQRFLHEALVTGDLDHPNIVPVHNLGRDTEGNLYLAMKLVRGTPWDRLLHANARDPAEAARSLRGHLEILLKVCDAMAFAHTRGIVHRDLKPENVMVGDFGEVLVMDWGIALDVSERPGGGGKAEHKSMARGPAGTPRYMAPELALADMARIGPRSDVYLLGAILYEILTGEPPHRGDQVHEVLLRAARGEVELPEQRAAARSIPRELSRITMRALAPDPELRYPDVASFVQALRDYLAHEESLRLAEEGDRALETLQGAAALGLGERYAAYTEALGRYGQALYLWGDNERAALGQARAAAAYAEEALARGDVGLAAVQLGVLERNPHAEARQVTAIRAAVERRSASRLRSATAALVVAVLVGMIWVSRAAWQGWEEEKRHLVEQRSERGQQVAAAFSAARDSDRAELGHLRHRLGGGKFEALADQRDVVDDVLWAEQLLLWTQGRWEELWDSLCAAPEVGEYAIAVRGQVLARPTLFSAPMVAWLKSTEGVAGTVLCRGFAEALRTGVSPEVVERAATLIGRVFAAQTPGAPARREARYSGSPPHWLPGVEERKELRERRRAMLVRVALYGVALTAARERGDQAAAQALESRLPPFRLASIPFGPVATGPAAAAPKLLRGMGGEWTALEPAMGGLRWRSLPWGRNKTVFTGLGVSDGSVLMAGEGQVVRLGGERGEVLARMELGGQVMLQWPDPLDAARLVVTVLTDRQRGYVEELGFRDGRPQQPLLPGEQLVSATLDGVNVLRGRLRQAALSELGIKPEDLPEPSGGEQSRTAREDPRRAAVDQRVLAGLRVSLERDPHNPDLWLAVLALLPEDAPPAEREALVQGMVETAATLFPWGAVRLGVNLERRGFVAAADQVYDRAARRFLELGGNADIAAALIGNPLLLLRQLGGEHFRAGRIDRALSLVETGRRFATYAEGDNRFYHLYARWLEKNDRRAEVARIAPRVAESEVAGGVFLLPASFILGVDVLLFVVLLCPALLFAVVLRAWRRARVAQRADLHARGMRTRWERIIAFATHPVDRLGCVFLAYAPRSERLAIFAIGAVFLTAVAFIAGSIRTIGEIAAVPVYVANGHPGNGGFLRYVEERIREGRGGTAALRLWAEGQWARGNLPVARTVLARILTEQPDDPVARNNLAVLDEEAGHIEAARAGYARVEGHSPGAEGAVARYNQARLAGKVAPRDKALAALAWRDRLHAEHSGPLRPLWARAGYRDLIVVLIGLDSVVARSWSAFVGLLNGKFGAIGEVLGGVSSDAPASHLGTLLIDAGGYSAMFFGLLALFALPFSVRPVVPSPSLETRGRRLGRRLVTLLSLLVPGLHDLVRGWAGLGALQLLLIAVCWGARNTLLDGGLLGNIAQVNVNQGYFPGVSEVRYPELAWVGYLATGLLILLFVVNVPLTYRRLRAVPVSR